MRKIIVVLVLALGWASPVAAQNLRIGGTGVGLALNRVLAEDFARRNPDVGLWLPDSLGSSGGIKALAAGKLDVAVIVRPLKAGEVGDGVSVPLCRTPWTFFSHHSRADIQLSRADLVGLYASSLPPYAQGEVRPLLRPENETGFAYLQEHFPELVPVIAAARQNRAAVEAINDQDAMNMVENGPSLVGFGALAPIIAEHRQLRSVALDGRDAAKLTADYPYWVMIYLAIGQDSSAVGRSFVEFARSPQAAALLRANGCDPIVGAPS